MSCNGCDKKVAKPYKNNSDAWNSVSLEVQRCNNSCSPALLPDEGICVGTPLFYDAAGQVTSVYAPGLAIAGLSHVGIDASENVADANGNGTCLPNMLEPNSEALFEVCFEEGAEACDLLVGQFYYFVAGDTGEMDSASAAPINPGNGFKLKEILGSCGAGCCTDCAVK